MWQHKAIPYVDPFSYTFQGVEWIDFEWLFQVVIYPLYQFFGFGGVVVFKIVVVLMTFIVLFLTCREVDEGNRWSSITILFIALLVARGRFLERPQIIALLFLALYFYLLTLYRGNRLTTRQIILFLLPIHILWVNFHGSFLLGIFLVGVYALSRFLPQALVHHRDLKPVFQDKKLQSLAFLCLLLCLASLLNPHTYRAFLISLQTAGAEESLRGITEWQPVDIKFIRAFATERAIWFLALFLGGIASFLINRRNLKKVEHIIIFLFFSYMAFKYIRFFDVFAIAVTPVIVSNLTTLRWQMGRWRWLWLLPLIVIVGFCVGDVGRFIKKQSVGFGVRRYYPEATVDFLEKHEVKGRIFNHFDFGGLIIWRLYPNIPVFIDGRTPTIYDQNFFWFYMFGERKKKVWEQIVERYGVEIVLMRDTREAGYTTLLYWLDEDENWRLVAFDDVSSLYLRKGPHFNELIEKYGFYYLRPSDIMMDYAKARKEDEGYLKALESELLEACRRFPHDFYPFYYLGVYHQMYGTKNHFQEAEKALRKAVANRPYFPLGYYELGFTLMKLERYNEAAEALKKSFSLEANLPVDAYFYLGTSLFHSGKTAEAITYLERYKEKAGWFGTRDEAYGLLGKAYMKKYKFQKALSCLERLSYLGEATWETYVNMGVAYFSLNKLDKAREYFEKSKELKPKNIKVTYNLAVTYEKLQLFGQSQDLLKQVAHMEPKSAEEEALVLKAREKLVGEMP